MIEGEEKMQNIKLFQDGERLIIVVEHATADLTQTVQNMLMAASINQVVGLKPISVPVEEPPKVENMEELKIDKTEANKKNVFPKGEFVGRTPEDVLKGNPKNLEKLFVTYKNYKDEYPDFSKHLTSVIKVESLKILNDVENKLNNMTREETGMFLQNHYFLFHKELVQILQQAGYGKQLSQFIQCELDSTVKAACRQCVKSAKQRMGAD